jgi:hypothetical protein
VVNKGNPKLFSSHPLWGLWAAFAFHPLFPFTGIAIGNPLEKVEKAVLSSRIRTLVKELLAVEVIRIGAAVPPGRKGKAADNNGTGQHTHYNNCYFYQHASITWSHKAVANNHREISLKVSHFAPQVRIKL